jgi:hypothetical protein
MWTLRVRMTRPKMRCVPRSSIAGAPSMRVTRLAVSLKLWLRCWARWTSAFVAAASWPRVRGSCSLRG